MRERDRVSIRRRAMKIFFKAMLAGYAGDGSGVKKEKTPDGYRTLTWPPEGDSDGFVVVDRYCVTPQSAMSAGTTTIFFRGEPIWWMSYGGEYSPLAITTLKMALAEAYKDGDFCGGRGHAHRFPCFEYRNDHYGNFVSFNGRETVRDPRGNELGYHRYFGMSLI